MMRPTPPTPRFARRALAPLLSLAPLALLAAAGCSNLTGIDRRLVDGVAYERRPSIIAQSGGASPRVVVPDTVVAGTPFAIASAH